MKKPLSLSVTLIAIFISVFSSCVEEDAPSGCDCQVEASCRDGAICNDGTSTTATGSGACSGHDGVDHWTCK